MIASACNESNRPETSWSCLSALFCCVQLYVFKSRASLGPLSRTCSSACTRANKPTFYTSRLPVSDGTTHLHAHTLAFLPDGCRRADYAADTSMQIRDYGVNTSHHTGVARCSSLGGLSVCPAALEDPLAVGADRSRFSFHLFTLYTADQFRCNCQYFSVEGVRCG
jgi:hypothetical protein